LCSACCWSWQRVQRSRLSFIRCSELDRSCGGEFRRAAASVAVFLREMDKNSKMKKLRRLGLLFLINAVILLPLVYGFEFFFRWKDPHKNLPINGWVNGEYFTWGHKEIGRASCRERVEI